MARRVAVVTLGCMKNRVESDLMEQKLSRAGWEVTHVDDDDPSAGELPLPVDAVIINTCCFILPAREEAIDTILAWARLKDEGAIGRLVVSGCLAQRYGAELADEIPEIDAILGTGDLERAVESLEGARERLVAVSGAGHDYRVDQDRAAYVRPPVGVVSLAGGCSRRCAFCVIPSVRGPYVSRPADLVRRDVEDLLARGCLEINLVAQDSTIYGHDLHPPKTLVSLLEELAGIPGRFWLRVLYTYPAAVSDELLDLLASGEPFTPYLDLPLQHMSDRVLKRMARPETARSNMQILVKARQRGLFIRTAFIVGFPGETEEDFSAVQNVLRDGMFNHAGIFAYSPEEGTAAFLLSGRVPEHVALERVQRAQFAWEEGAERLHQSLIGQILPVLADGPSPGWGRHWGQAPDIDGYTFVDGLPAGISDVTITAATAADFWGKMEVPGGEGREGRQ